MELNELLARKLNKEKLDDTEELVLLEVSEKALAYLNYKKSDELNFNIKRIIADMALEKLKLIKAESESSSSDGVLKSISMGDAEYSFYEKDARKNYDSAIASLEEELRAYRRLSK
nr:MAG TPA: hypothetical protein [Caudoviricetes sp.]